MLIKGSVDMIRSHYEIIASDINFQLDLRSNLVLIDGYSGVGKTMLFKQIRKDSIVNPQKNIVCFNYENATGNNINLLQSLKGLTAKLVFIDNAEIILSDACKEYISIDTKNQYIIFTHTTKGFYPQRNSLAILRVKNGKGTLFYDMT